MSMIKGRLKILVMVVMAVLISLGAASTGWAAELVQSKIPTGKRGGTVTISFTIENPDEYWNGQYISVYDPYSESNVGTYEEGDTMNFPFEKAKGSLSPKKLSGIKNDSPKTVSVTARVRRDAPEGYYNVEVGIASDPNDFYLGNQPQGIGSVTVWIANAAASSTSKEDTETKNVVWSLGENQTTPYGVYPNVLDFALNLKNRGSLTAQDVTASLTMAKSSEEFPFDINEVSYDRYFSSVPEGETVVLPYSFAIRKDCYTGFYPIKMVITWRESSGGELKKEELTFFVHVVSKTKEDEKNGEFNPNNRVKARIIVDSYSTVPEVVYAGEEFDLKVVMKNASEGVPASNLLFNFESEKVSDSPAITVAGGSNSMVVNSLASGAVTELVLHCQAGAAIDQRAYTMKISEKYDSPEFKNAEESVNISIPVKQVAKINVGNIEILPESINVGGECNVMFAVNNTGKVLLYNVMADFEADSIQPLETYVGNIKPGETGNVDVMLKGVAATTDDGMIDVHISYEDEHGTVTTEDRKICIYVNDVPEIDINDFDIPPEEPEQVPFYKKPIAWAGAAALAAVLAAVIIIRNRKRKKALEAEGEDDETV